MKNVKHETMTEALKAAMIESKMTGRDISAAVGGEVNRASISRFLSGNRSLRLDKADLLARYFGIEIIRKGKKS